MKKPSVLVVDDEVDVAKEIAEIIKETDEFNVLNAYSGSEAVETVKNNIVDLVLLDIKMPGMSGIETLKEIKKMKPDVRVIMLTALDEAKYAWEASHSGASDYLTKPFNEQDVILRIKLNTSERQKEIEEIKKWRLIEQLRQYNHTNPEGATRIWEAINDELIKRGYDQINELPYFCMDEIFKKHFK
jgi:DNA-binding response OmpR family regulator